MHADEDQTEPGHQTQELLADWMNRQQLARELGVCVDTLTAWQTQRRGPPSIRLGRRVLYRRDAVQKWLIEQERFVDVREPK